MFKIVQAPKNSIETKVLCKIFFLAGNLLLKGSNKNTIVRCEICSKLTIKTPERRQLRLAKE